MNFNKSNFERNEKLFYNISLGILIASIVLFGISVLVLRMFDFLKPGIGILGGIGIVLSMIVVLIGNIRLIRFVFIVRKQNSEVAIWKSAISIAYGIGSLFIYWFIALLLALSSFS